MNTVEEPVSAAPPQEIASPTRPAGLPLMDTDPEPPDSAHGCAGAGQLGHAWGA